MKITTLPLAIFCLFIACTANGPGSNLQPLNLLKKGGIPISILAPDSATVQTMDLIVQKDISVKGADNYYVQIFASDATERNNEALKTKLKKEAQKLPFFSKIVSDEENGFIFENKIDSSTTSYDFRHFKVKGDTEYIFQTGLIGNFSQEDAKMMFDAVKQQ